MIASALPESLRELLGSTFEKIRAGLKPLLRKTKEEEEDRMQTLLDENEILLSQGFDIRGIFNA
jgi:hypothetical protein